MAFVTLQDLKGSVEVVVFPDTYERVREHLTEDNTVFIKGAVDAKEETRKVLANDIIPLTEASQFYTEALIVDLRTIGLETENLERLKELLIANKGSTTVFVNFRDPNNKITTLALGDELRVSVTEDLFFKNEEIYGEGCVKIKIGSGPKIPDKRKNNRRFYNGAQTAAQ